MFIPLTWFEFIMRCLYICGFGMFMKNCGHIIFLSWEIYGWEWLVTVKVAHKLKPINITQFCLECLFELWHIITYPKEVITCNILENMELLMRMFLGTFLWKESGFKVCVISLIRLFEFKVVYCIFCPKVIF